MSSFVLYAGINNLKSRTSAVPCETGLRAEESKQPAADSRQQPLCGRDPWPVCCYAAVIGESGNLLIGEEQVHRFKGEWVQGFSGSWVHGSKGKEKELHGQMRFYDGV